MDKVDYIDKALSSVFEDLPLDEREFLRSTIGRPSVDVHALAVLYSLIRAIGPAYILEIGLATGSSASCHSLAAKPTLERFDIVDPLQKSVFRNVGLKNVATALGRDNEKVIFHKMPSHAAMAQLLAAQIRYDYIFIDGDHRFDATMVDVFYANHLLKVGGHLVIDDRPWPQVGGVIEFMRTNYPHFAVDLRHPRLSIFRKTNPDPREWFDFWHFEIPVNLPMQDRIKAYQQARDERSASVGVDAR